MSTDNPPPVRVRLSLRRLAREAATLTTGTAGTTALLVVQSILVARSLGDSLLGIWGYMQAMVSLPRGLLGFRVPEALGRFLVEYDQPEDDARKLILSTSLYLELAVSLATLLVALAIAPYIATHVARRPELLPLFQLFAVTALLGWIQPLWQGIVRYQRAFARLAAVPVAATAVQVAALAGLWAAGRLDLSAMVWTSIGYTIVLSAAQWPEVRQVMAARLPVRECWSRRREIRTFWEFMTTGYFENTMRGALAQADILLLGRFMSNEIAGEYRLAKSLASVAGAMARSLASVSYQDFNDALKAGQRIEIRDYLVRLTKAWVPLVALVTAVTWVVAPWVIHHVYGPEFEETPALFRVLVIGTGVSVILFWGRQLLMAYHELKYLMGIIYWLGCGNLIAMYFAARFASPTVFAASTLLLAVFGNLLVAWRAWRLSQPEPEA